MNEKDVTFAIYNDLETFKPQCDSQMHIDESNVVMMCSKWKGHKGKHWSFGMEWDTNTVDGKCSE